VGVTGHLSRLFVPAIPFYTPTAWMEAETVGGENGMRNSETRPENAVEGAGRTSPTAPDSRRSETGGALIPVDSKPTHRLRETAWYLEHPGYGSNGYLGSGT
jgi:hypothetical protein